MPIHFNLQKSIFKTEHTILSKLKKMYRFGLRETSEKTTEINTMSDVTSFIQRISGRKVTIIAPTQNDEKDLGFDEIIEDLPSGQVAAFQFKRPYNTPSIPNCSRFYLDTQQLQKLLNNFSPREAFYVLVPFPFNSDFIQNRRNLLCEAMAVDPHDIPNPRKTSQKSRTIRYYRRGISITGNFSTEIRVADPRVYETISKTSNLERLCKLLMEEEAGIRISANKEKPRVTEKKKRFFPRKMFYVHLSSEPTEIKQSSLGI